jgi:hypothetical protein
MAEIFNAKNKGKTAEVEVNMAYEQCRSNNYEHLLKLGLTDCLPVTTFLRYSFESQELEVVILFLRQHLITPCAWVLIDTRTVDTFCV